MDKIEPAMLHGMQAELMKTASLGATLAGVGKYLGSTGGRKTLGLAGAMGGHGAAIGAGIGGIYKGYKGYSDAKEQGQDTEGALKAGLGAGVGGAMSGALYGGIAGAGAGAAVGRYHPKADQLREALSTEKNWTGSLGRFGQRQMHGITGVTPEKGLESIRGGSWRSQLDFDAIKAKGGDITKAQKTLDVDKAMAGGGLTSVPGIAKTFLGKNKDVSRTEAVKRMLGHQWHSQGAGGKALMVGMTGLPLMSALTSSSEGGKGEQVGNIIGSTAGAVVGSALPFYPQGKLMEYSGAAGKKIGKGVDWALGRRNPHAMAPTEAASMNVPMSPDAGEVLR